MVQNLIQQTQQQRYFVVISYLANIALRKTSMRASFSDTLSFIRGCTDFIRPSADASGRYAKKSKASLTLGRESSRTWGAEEITLLRRSEK